MKYEKIITHPDLEEILKQIKDGVNYDTISTYLRDKYPNDAAKYVSASSLQRFVKDGLDIIRNKETTFELLQERVEAFKKNNTPIEAVEAIEEALITIAPTIEEGIKDLMQHTLSSLNLVVTQTVNQERDSRDIKNITSALRDMAEIYKVFNSNNLIGSQNNTSNDYNIDAYLIEDTEVGDVIE